MLFILWFFSDLQDYSFCDFLCPADNHGAHSLDHMVSPTSHATPVPKASAKALTIVQSKHLEDEDVSEKSSSNAGGNILGLANYTSDDEDDKTQTSNMPNSTKTANLLKSDSIGPPSDVNDAAERETQPVEGEERISARADLVSGCPMKRLIESKSVGSDSGNNEVNVAGNLTFSDVSPKADQVNVNGKMVDNAVVSISKETLDDHASEKSKLEEETVGRKPTMDDTHNVESTMTHRDGHKRTSAGDSLRGPKSGNVNVDKKFDENQKKDERHPRKEKTERDDSKGAKGLGKHGEKIMESDVRRRPGHSDIKDTRKDRDRSYRDNEKDDSRRTERSRDKEEDRSRHKASLDLSKHRRRRSTSTGSRGQNNRDNLASREKNSSDEYSDDSRRFTIMKLSPLF